MIQLTEAQEAELQKLVDAGFYSSVEEALEAESSEPKIEISDHERRILEERLAACRRGEGVPLANGKELVDRVRLRLKETRRGAGRDV